MKRDEMSASEALTVLHRIFEVVETSTCGKDKMPERSRNQVDFRR
jgi:hypothetical protein